MTAPGARASDAELLARARKDPEAFHAFYQRHCLAIDAWLRKETGNLDVAAELTAETFAQAWFGLKRFKGIADGDGARWLFGIARNLSRSYFRKRRVEESARRKLGITVTRYEPDAHEQIARNLTAPELHAALEGLPSHEREAVELRVVSQMSYREVAVRLHCTENAARLRVSRALRSLRMSLGHEPAVGGRQPGDGGLTDE
jgi:RNA polymerase sigma-70 factor (ECF subfamily)